METKTIQSWISQRVRIKEEYIETARELNEDKSTYDDNGNIIEEVYDEYEYINVPNGMKSCFQDREREIFNVRYDCYGVDLYKVRNRVDVDTLPEPTHQIIVGNQNDYPYMWDSKYFEVVTYKTTIEETTDNEFNN
jgi:hypothetical protein